LYTVYEIAKILALIRGVFGVQLLNDVTQIHDRPLLPWHDI